MQRATFQAGDGFTYGRTELQGELVATKDGCHDGIAWADLDGDGCIDLVGIETRNGHDDADHELVGLHVPSGRVVWRALTGEVSREVALVNGVIVCSANERNTLRGLDPRSGRPLWSVSLDDALKDDPYDGFDGARAITASGPFAVYECDNGFVQVLDAQSGRILLKQQGKLGCHTLGSPGLVCIRNGEDYDNKTFTVIDLFQNRVVYQAPDDDIGMATGSGRVAFFHFDPPNGTHVTVLDLRTRQIVAKASVKKNDGDCPMTNASCDDVHAGVILDDGRILKGRRHDEIVHVFDLGRRSAVAQPPPRAGLMFWQMVRQGQVLFVAYQQKDGTPRVVLTAWNAATLQPLGVLEGFGGHSIPNAILSAPTGLLASKTVTRDAYWKQNNPVAWWHLDPASGQKVTEYPVPEIGCVELYGKFLCAAMSYYSGGNRPVVYDTERRERLL